MLRIESSSKEMADPLIGQIGKKVQNLFLTRQLMCSETVLIVMNQGLGGGLPPETAVRIASGLPEGLGSGCLCGSLSGAVLALGLFLGRTGPGIANGRRVINATRYLHDTFRSHFGATCCRILTRGVGRGSREQYLSCSRIAAFAAETAARIILHHRPELIDSADMSYLNHLESWTRGSIKKITRMICS